MGSVFFQPVSVSALAFNSLPEGWLLLLVEVYMLKPFTNYHDQPEEAFKELFATKFGNDASLAFILALMMKYADDPRDFAAKIIKCREAAFGDSHDKGKNPKEKAEAERVWQTFQDALTVFHKIKDI
ncbi:hypothetical protein ACQSGA_24815 [Salmonella enterica]|uniref:hypothetical protein n=1 Tax=Salmonella enterica TaxID=28901 RepID=UPI0012713065|nr:hypothetical protein [Salmonella enterica subsp. diarizonae]